MIRIDTPARAGILGNPSDGFFGKTIAAPVRNFHACVILFEWDRIEILPGPTDRVNFDSPEELLEDFKINGYYGGFRLVKAAIKQFFDHVQENKISIPKKNFTIRYTSNIPRQVGLAGSSAIITSTIKALSHFYSVDIPKPIMANRVLWSETKELDISAGLQDRVVQVYDQPVFMDFEQSFMQQKGFGRYQPIDATIFPPMYLAYQANLTHKDTIHNDVRKRFECGDLDITNTMDQIGKNALDGLNALKNGDLEGFKNCIDKNFDLRASIYPIAEKNKLMIEKARAIGATAKFPGSGGAIIGTYDDDSMFNALLKEFGKIGCEVVKIQMN